MMAPEAAAQDRRSESLAFCGERGLKDGGLFERSGHDAANKQYPGLRKSLALWVRSGAAAGTLSIE